MLVCCFRTLRNMNGAWTLLFGTERSAYGAWTLLFGTERSAYMRKDPVCIPPPHTHTLLYFD